MTELTREAIEKYLMANGHPMPESDGTLDEFMNGEERQGMYDEAVRNNYDLPDVDRWFHLVKVMGVDMKFETAMAIDRALYEEDLETMELNLPEERLGLGMGRREVLNGSFAEVKNQIMDQVEKGTFPVGRLTRVQTPGLTLEDSFKLYAELRGEMDGAKTLFMRGRDEVWELSRTEDTRLVEYELREIIDPYLTKEDPLYTYIEQEVPFRLREMHGLDVSDGVCAEIADALKNEHEVMFDFDYLDHFLLKKYEEICEIALEGNDRGEPKQHKFIFDDELMINDDFESINGYLWAVDYLVDKIPGSDVMENINFYADFNVQHGGLTLTASYDTYEDGKEVNRVVDIPITLAERVEIISEMETHCQKKYKCSCAEFVQEVKDGERFGDGLEPVFDKEQPSDLDKKIQAADALRVPNLGVRDQGPGIRE